jgi:hypothetical protein
MRMFRKDKLCQVISAGTGHDVNGKYGHSNEQAPLKPAYYGPTQNAHCSAHVIVMFS